MRPPSLTRNRQRHYGQRVRGTGSNPPRPTVLWAADGAEPLFPLVGPLACVGVPELRAWWPQLPGRHRPMAAMGDRALRRLVADLSRSRANGN